MKLLLHGIIAAALQAGSDVLSMARFYFLACKKAIWKFRNYLWYCGDTHNLLSYFSCVMFF